MSYASAGRRSKKQMANPGQESQTQKPKEQEVFVGPRPFERSERGLFFGRDREISELLSLVISSRVVLCYAPSGAGKTSLINAGLEPRLEKEGFEVLPSSRVRGLIPAGTDQKKIINIFMFNVLMSLAGTGGKPAELTGRSLEEHLATHPHVDDEEGFPAPRILIFDQFEELLTSYPERWQEREEFFRQVYDALQNDPLLRVLFVMREDFLARVEPFTRLLKPFSQARFHLDLLGQEGARAAVTGPLRDTGRSFKDGVVDALIEELRKVRVETTQGEAVDVVGEYVEPVQLQVVCRNLWMGLPSNVQEISKEHLKAYGDVDHALRDFYESCLAIAKNNLGANESEVRNWFELQLITPAGTRGIVFRDADRTADLPNNIVEFLEDWHLIRGEWRAGSRWYELTHDRFIEPIQRANERWRLQRVARRTKLALSLAIPLVLAILIFAGVFSTRSYSSSSAVASTAVAATINVVEANAKATATVQAEQAQVAIEDVALSKSRQLAAQALLTSDPSLSLLLAAQANRFKDTTEARKSLHKILSSNESYNETVLREFNPEIISPRLVKRLEENTSYVQTVAFSPDGSHFISGSQDGKLILWDFATTKPVGDPLPAPSSSFLSVAFSPDGKLIAAATTGLQILLWDASTRQPIGNFSGHGDTVTCVAFSPDGKKLVSGSVDKTIRIWDVSQGQLQFVKEVAQPADVWSVAWSPDGKTLAVAGAGSNIRLLNGETFERIGTLLGENGFVRALAWSPDGKTLVAGSASRESEPSYGDLTFWDIANSKVTQRLLSDTGQPVRTVAFDPSGRFVAVGQDDRTITFIDAVNKKVISDPIKAHSHRITSLAFSPNGQYLVSGSLDTTIALWDLSTPTRSIAASSTSNLLATSQGAVINLWDLTGGKTALLFSLYGHTDDITALAFSPEGSILASAERNNIIRLWDSNTGKLLGTLINEHRGITTLAISPDGTILASGGQDGMIDFWDIGSQKDLASFYAGGAVAKLSFSEEDNALQATTTGGELITLDPQTFSPRDSEALVTIQGDGATKFAVSQDGQHFAFYEGTGSASFLTDGERAHGLEISLYSDSFDPTVNPKDVDFVVVKATEGIFVDRKFEDFLTPIQKVPMRGALHIYRAGVPWQEQADLFLSTVGGKGFHFYVLDLEVELADLEDVAQWINYVEEKTDRKVLLQAGAYLLNSIGSAGDWMKAQPLLIMQYPSTPDRNGNPILPSGFTDWKIWQYTENGAGVEFGIGADSAVLELYNGTPKEMWEWLAVPVFSLYDKGTGELIHPNLTSLNSTPNDITFSPDNSFVAVAGNSAVLLLNTETGEEISTLRLGGGGILSLSFVNDSELAVGMDDGTVILWDLDLLRSNAKAEQTLELSCSLLDRNFTSEEWTQYVGDTEYQKTCSNLP